MFPNSSIPLNMPDISMRQLNDDEVEDMPDVSLADAIKEARRRQQVNQNQQRDATNAESDEQLATIRTTPDADAPSASEKTIAPNPDAPCDSPTSKLESVLVEERSVRRRLNDDATETNIDQLVDKQVTVPQFFGKNACK